MFENDTFVTKLQHGLSKLILEWISLRLKKTFLKHDECIYVVSTIRRITDSSHLFR